MILITESSSGMNPISYFDQQSFTYPLCALSQMISNSSNKNWKAFFRSQNHKCEELLIKRKANITCLMLLVDYV